MTDLAPKFWTDDTGQDIAEYAVMLAVILVLVVGTIRLVGANANRGYSSMVGREEVFESAAQFPLFHYSIPMLPEAAQFGGTPACQWFSGLELFLPRIRRRS